jgi:valyl-tRNA synthetase
LWTALTGGESVVIAPWPMADPSHADAGATADVAAIQAAVTEVRRFRSDQGLKPAQRVPARITGATATVEPAVRALLRLDEPDDAFTVTASLTTSRAVTIELDLSGTIDVAAERARLAKDRVAEAVVGKVRDRLAAAEAEIARIDAALAALPPA